MQTLLVILVFLFFIDASAQDNTDFKFLKTTYAQNQNVTEVAIIGIESVSKLHPRTFVTYNAGQSILLSPGFLVSKGANFIAQLKSGGEARLQIAVLPNPVNQQSVVKFSLPKEAKISLYVINMKGQIVKHLVDNSITSIGSHEIIWDATGLDAGIYMTILRTGFEEISFRTVKK